MQRVATACLALSLVTGYSTRASAWNDAPLCMAQSPAEHEEHWLLESRSDPELSCQPEDVIRTQGPLWTAPISAAEARQALRDVETLAVQAPADALLKLRLVERAMPRLLDRLALQRADLLLRLSRPAEACEAYEAAADSPERNVAAEGRIGLARCLLEANKRQGEGELEKLCKRYPNLSERFALRLLQAKARESWNNIAGALQLYRAIDMAAPETGAAAQAREAMERLRAAGVRVPPYTALETVERVEKIYERGTVELARGAIADLLTMSGLPAPLKGRAHLLAARVARLEGRWDTVREEVARALSFGVPAGEANRLLPRTAAASTEGLDPSQLEAQGQAKLKKLTMGRPIRRLKTPQLRGALDLALQHGLRDAATEVLETIASRSTMPPQARFDAGLMAAGVASDASVLALFDGLRNVRPMRAAASYYRARALERMGREQEARSDYRNVIELDDGYYAMWAQARLTAFEQVASGTCRRDATGKCAPDIGVQPPHATDAAEPAAAPSAKPKPFPGLSAVVGNPENTEGAAELPNAAEQRRETVVARLRALAAVHGAGYPWLARAADLAELERYDDAAAEVGETYLAWRDARGGLRVRAGVEAVLTNSAPPRHAALGNVRRDRLALDGTSRLALADIADLLEEPGVALRLRDQRGEPRPRAYATDVEQAAAKYGIDPNLLFAVMRVESVYYRHIVSFAGAIGLMQIMPRTGMRIARALGVSDFNTLDLLNPRKNLEFAAWYLSSLINRFDGRLPLAIAAYNGGPHNVRLWLSQYPSTMPLDAFLERIPFTETHRYVRRVLTHYAAYRAQKNLPMPNLAVTFPRLQPDAIAF